VSAFGDSVLLGAEDQLVAQLAPSPVTVDAQEDRSLLGAISILQAARPTMGDIVVLDLGYNDDSDPAVFRQRIDGAMAALAGVAKVIWLNQSLWSASRAGMNAELAAAATRYGNLEVVDWSAVVDAHPEDVYDDRIHLTPAGQVALAALVRQHVDAYVMSLNPPTTSAPSTTTRRVLPTSTAPPVALGAEQPAAHHGSTNRRVGFVAIVAGLVLAAVMVAAAVARRRSRRPRRR
jgi:hypothetical protein